MQLIGLTGRAGAGKDTVAEYLCNEHNFAQISFAQPIRDGLAAMFKLPAHQLTHRALKEKTIEWLGRSPRELMQTLGTEWGRTHVAEDLWLICAERSIQALRTTFPALGGIVISDVRFENEAEWLKHRNGKLWLVNRPTGAETNATTAQHTSEQFSQQNQADRTIHNTGTLEDFYQTLASTITPAMREHHAREQDARRIAESNALATARSKQ